jgi:hypothetical protein
MNKKIASLLEAVLVPLKGPDFFLLKTPIITLKKRTVQLGDCI